MAHMGRALALSRTSVHVRRMSGWTCMIASKHERSIEDFRRAMQLESMNPWAYEAYWGIAYPHFFTGRYEEAVAGLDKALLERPNLVNAFRLQIEASAMAGRPSGKKCRKRWGGCTWLSRRQELMQRIAHVRQVDLELYAKALCLRRSAGIIGRRLAKILVADVRCGSIASVS